MQEERFETGDGLSIFFRSWRPATNIRGVVVIVHGFNAHSGYYAWAAEQFVAAGLAVYALDLRGRGHSDGERFFVETFADYVADVASFVDAREIAGARPAGVPARPQRRRHRRLPLHARPSAAIARPDLRELRVPDAGAGFCARGAERSEPSRATRARSASQE